jgi:pimeloyl-ACP methyl ester carboxylesterase
MKLHRLAKQFAGILGAAASIALLGPCAIGTAAPATDSADGPNAAVHAANITAVLVHGAWADGSAWEKVTPLLQARGIKVVSVQLHLTSLAEDVAIVRRVVEVQTGKVVLVGHSYGGAVITQAGTDPKVGSLVYVAAFAPDAGQSVDDMLRPYPPAVWQSGLVPDSAGYTTLTPASYQTYFASDLPKDYAAVLATAQGPTSQQVLMDKVTNAAWTSKPSFWALSADDQIIPPAFQQQEAAHIKAKVTTVRGAGHTEMLSHPREIAGVILQASAAIK